MKVAVVMGSDSDYEIMQQAGQALSQLKIEFDEKVLSAHRTPHHMIEFGTSAANSQYSVIIAGAGGAAHLPGMLAACTCLPVIGVPIPNGPLQGQDALLSIVQMPKGVPVATVAIGAAFNAGLLAAQILSIHNQSLREELLAYKNDIKNMSLNKILPTKEWHT